MPDIHRPAPDYQLLDFGQGRKLEQFGTRIVDRPCPAAQDVEIGDPQAWKSAELRFNKSGERGRWRKLKRQENGISPEDAPWNLDCKTFRLELRKTPFGHVGVFPEQAGNWERIERLVRSNTLGDANPFRLLNLFAYTGGSSLAAAAAGAEVVHVDSSKTTVQWARENAAASQLADAPVRWIVEDARRFVSREVRRGNKYEAIVLDPPSYGHGAKGEPWKLTQNLMPLLNECRELLSDHAKFVLLSCHSPNFGLAELAASLRQTMFGHCQGHVESFHLTLNTCSGRTLHAGMAALARF